MTRKTLCKLLAVPVCVLLILLLCAAPAVAALDMSISNSWTPISSLPTAAGSYKLMNDVAIDKTWSVPNGITNLDLNGYSITLTGESGRVISISSSRTLNLYDTSTSGTGKITGGKSKLLPEGYYSSGGGVSVYGTFTMYGGSITNNSEGTNGGGVYVYNTGKFSLVGGSITNNTAPSGAGVLVYGDFVMSGGNITGNVATGDGAGVLIYSTKVRFSSDDHEEIWFGSFAMSGGVITDNMADGRGGGVFVQGNWTLRGGTETTTEIPGAIFKVGGGKITGNLVTGLTENVYLTENATIGIIAESETLGGMSIGVTTYDNPSANNLVEFTGLNNGNYASYFFADDSAYHVENRNNILYLVSNEPVVPIDPEDPTVLEYDGILFSEWTSEKSLPSFAGSYYLTDDILLKNTWSVPIGETKFCLNGHSIIYIGTRGERAINVPTDATLDLYDNIGTGKITSSDNSRIYSGGVSVSGTFNMYGGNITNNTAFTGGGVYVKDGSFTLIDGVITGNSVRGSGNGVYVTNGSFTLTGGKIVNNTAPKSEQVSGGGVYAYDNSTVVISGGDIANNVAFWGGGIYAGYSTVVISGGNIVNNSAYRGGGILCTNLTMTDGNISGNIAEQDGGGIAISYDSTAIMSGGVVTGNIATKSGGGIYIENKATFTMSDGSIANNNAIGGLGGGVYNYGTFILLNGNIANNTARSYGGGVITYDTFTMNGGSITGNTVKMHSGGGVLFNDGTFTITGGIISDNHRESGTLDNVHIPQSSTPRLITIDPSGLKSNTNIGVNKGSLITEDSPVAITGQNNADYSRYFFADNASLSIKNIDNVLYLAYNTVIEPVINTTDSVNAATVAEVGYETTPTRVSELTAPILTRNGKSVPLNDSVVVKKMVRGAETEVTATVNPDGTLNINPEDIADADSVSVMFIGRKIGDVSGKGKPGISDAVMVLKSSSHMLTLDAKADFYGDVTGEGRIDLMDAVRILQYSAHMTDDDYKLK